MLRFIFNGLWLLTAITLLVTGVLLMVFLLSSPPTFDHIDAQAAFQPNPTDTSAGEKLTQGFRNIWRWGPLVTMPLLVLEIYLFWVIGRTLRQMDADELAAAAASGHVDSDGTV